MVIQQSSVHDSSKTRISHQAYLFFKKEVIALCNFSNLKKFEEEKSYIIIIYGKIRKNGYKLKNFLLYFINAIDIDKKNYRFHTLYHATNINPRGNVQIIDIYR